MHIFTKVLEFRQQRVFYCIALYCIGLYCIVLNCIVLYCIELYFILLYCRYFNVLAHVSTNLGSTRNNRLYCCNAMQCNTIQCNIILMQYNTDAILIRCFSNTTRCSSVCYNTASTLRSNTIPRQHYISIHAATTLHSIQFKI